MSANWGRKLKLSIFGESHAEAIGINIDGLEPGTKLDLENIRFELDRRKPGRNNTSPRTENDDFEILSGVLNGVTTGAPICVIFRNKDTKSKDYSELKVKMRASHSDYPAFIKYKAFNDIRGGGHFSGRITAAIVFVGSIAKTILKEKGIDIFSHVKSIYDLEDSSFLDENFNEKIKVDELLKLKDKFLPFLNKDLEEKANKLISDISLKNDSIGGRVECMIANVNPGLGSPFFDSIESTISHLAFSIPSVKAIEFGLGFDITKKTGASANDYYYYDDKKNIKTKTNNTGGITGGITNGMPIIFTVAIKPTASILQIQETIDIDKKENTTLNLTGRHDPCIVPRVIPVIESIAAIAILDHILMQD